jgi:hypothetical protein
VSRRTVSVLSLVLALAVLALPSVGAAGQTAVPRTLEVDLTEWAVVPSHGFVAAGPLHLTVVNAGVLRHKLAIVPTGWWGENVPILRGRVAREHASPALLVAPGQRRSAQVYLPPGSYLLVDDVRGHYALGAAVHILAG